jgi:hypothetical protein
VRANQPTVRAALRQLPWVAAPGSRRRERGHGPTESGSIKVIDLGHWHRAAVPWRAAGDHGRPPTRHRRRALIGGDRLRAHLAGSPGPDPGLLAAWRRPWAIENRVHHVRDVTQREDASCI